MFSQTVEYALRATLYLAEHPDSAASSERISEAMQVPKPYLSKILRDLVVAEIVSSMRGPNGGFVLAKPAHVVTVLDVVNAVDPIRRIKTCPLGRPEHQQLCPLHRQMDSAIEHVECSLRSTTLAQLAMSTASLPAVQPHSPPTRGTRRSGDPHACDPFVASSASSYSDRSQSGPMTLRPNPTSATATISTDARSATACSAPEAT